MASTTTSGLPPNFFLTPQQQNLLFAALNSNRQAGAQQGSPSTSNALSLSPTSFKDSPQQKDAFQESPYLDNYDYDFGPDSSFDFDFANGDQPKMIGDIPGTARSESTENDAHDKRSHPDDEDEPSPDNSTGNGNGNGNKRRESTEKTAKKPGRKPLTTEPSSKRKAQNRAAQRAFRERKEKHLKDLETKVEELEKASEAANHENSILRAQVERMTTELNEYKQKVTVMSTNTRLYGSQHKTNGFGHAAINNLNDVNFQFEFPKFGMLPGPPIKQSSRSSSSLSPPAAAQESSPVSPFNSNQVKETSRSPFSLGADSPLDKQTKDDLASLSGLFGAANTANNASRTSLDSGHYSLGPTATSSPSASSSANMGPSSSCGTSPEPFTQSPMGFKPVDTLSTIEEQPNGNQGFNHFAGIDINSFDWLAQQNGGNFDPQLFTEYREPQENILSNTTLDESFFNDALDADFFTPYNMAPSPAVSKKSLIAEIDAKQNADDDSSVLGPEHSKITDDEKLSRNQMWEKLQACPKVQSGEFDLDGLCSELQKKAKCSGNGPVVAETDFQAVVNKWMGKECADKAAASK